MPRIGDGNGRRGIGRRLEQHRVDALRRQLEFGAALAGQRELVAVQLGLYLGARKTIVGMIDHTRADLWVMSYGAKSFEESQLQNGRQRYAALSVPGVESVTPLVVSFVRWRKRIGGAAKPTEGG